MKFVADSAIPHIREAFSSIGDVNLLSAKEISSASLVDVDGLLTRTTVKVTPELLKDSRMTFLGTATIGTDHIDIPYIRARGIHLASAPGCNAVAVGEYVLAALMGLQKKGLLLQGKTMGIIGAGNTGQAVKQKMEAIGMPCFLNDPPLAESGDAGDYLDLDELVHRVDILSVHVPLTRSGPHPTVHLIDDQLLRKMRPGAIIINTSRGETVDGKALKQHRSRLAAIVLDVWENEPEIDPDLIPDIDIATPHIAGYSIEGKLKATRMLYDAACRFFNRQASWQYAAALAQYGKPSLTVSAGDRVLENAVSRAYPILEDDARLRRYPNQDNPGDYFADLRNHYAYRREFSSYSVNVSGTLTSRENHQLTSVGFQISDS